jgi:hypothetical protein
MGSRSNRARIPEPYDRKSVVYVRPLATGIASTGDLSHEYTALGVTQPCQQSSARRDHQMKQLADILACIFAENFTEE